MTVRIGNSLCNVTSLSRQQLTCRPPLTQPPGIDEDGNPAPQELPQVVVSMWPWQAFESHICVSYVSCTFP